MTILCEMHSDSDSSSRTIINVKCEMDATEKTCFRSMADLNQQYQQRQSAHSNLLAEHAQTFRSLSELKKAFQQKQSAYSCLLAKHSESCALAEQGTGPTNGIITKVFQDQGYGFIAPHDGSKDVFLHFRDLVDGCSQDLLVGTELRFDLFIDEFAKRKAKNATLTKLQAVHSSITSGQRYSREMLLRTFTTLRKVDAHCEGNPIVTLRKVDGFLPEPCADMKSVKTSGDCAEGDWANKIRSILPQCRFSSGDSTPTATGDSASEREYDLQDFLSRFQV